MRRVLGIDPGIQSTGFGIIDCEKSKLVPVKFGTVNPPTKKKIADRLSHLYNDIVSIIKSVNPTEMAIEEAFFSKNAKSALVLSQARGVTLLAAAHHKISSFEYSPRKVKMSVVGNGAASKQQVQYMIKSMLNLSDIDINYDISDAFAVAICHINNQR